MAVPLLILAVPEVTKVVLAALNPRVHKEDDGVFIKCGLAKSFGKLQEHYQAMDEKMKVMIGVTLAQLEKLPTQDLTWENVKECLFNNPCLQPMDDEDVTRHETLVRATTAWFTSGTTELDDDSLEVSEAENWIKKLISDEDVIANLSFEPKTYARFVSCTGIALGKLEDSQFVSREKHYKTVVDIGILRFPDMDNPYFKVYRLSLKAFRDCTHTLLWDWNNNGIVGEYHCRKFSVREKFVKEIKEKTKAKAMDMVDNLF